MIRKLFILVILLFCSLLAFAGSADINTAFSGYLSQFDSLYDNTSRNTASDRGASDFLSSYFEAVSNKDSDVIPYEDFMEEENEEINGLSIDDYLDYLFAQIMNPGLSDESGDEAESAVVEENQQLATSDTAISVYKLEDKIASSVEISDPSINSVNAIEKKKRKTKFEVFILPSVGFDFNDTFNTETVYLGVGGGLGIRDLIRMGEHIGISLKGVMAKNLSFITTLDFKFSDSRIYGGPGFCKNGIVLSFGYLYITKKGWEFGVDLTAANTDSGVFLNSAIMAGFAF